MHQLGNDHTDGTGGVTAAVAQLLGNDIRKIIVLAGILLNGLATFAGNARAIAQRPRYGRNRYAQFAGDILHCQVSFIIHW